VSGCLGLDTLEAMKQQTISLFSARTGKALGKVIREAGDSGRDCLRCVCGTGSPGQSQMQGLQADDSRALLKYSVTWNRAGPSRAPECP
jgi:hypothetical protein